MLVLQDIVKKPSLITGKDSILDCSPKNTRSGHLKESMYNIVVRDDESILVFNTVTEALLKFSSEEWDNRIAIANDLMSYGLFVHENEDELFKICSIKNANYYTASNVKQFTILPTSGCNARCFYCFEAEMLKHSMNDEIAEQTINYIVSSINKDDFVIFDWFGGEPMVGEYFIDKIIDGVKQRCNWELKYKSIMISNGTLFTIDKIDKYVNQWHLTRVQLTVDGTEEEHNKRKSLVNKDVNAYVKVKEAISMFLQKNIEVFVRINFDQNNYHLCDDILDDFSEFSGDENFVLFPAVLKEHCAGAISDIFSESEYSKLYSTVYEKLVRKGYIRYLDELLPNVKWRPCLAGNVNSIVIDDEGYLYKCPQQFHDKDLSIGTCSDGIVYNDILKFWATPNDFQEECETCSLLPMCFGGCKYNLQETVNISVCIKYKYIIEDMLKTASKLFEEKCLVNR